MGIEFTIEQSKIIDGVFTIKPNIAADIRGNIWTSYMESEFNKFLPSELNFGHDKFSNSKFNVLRGIHWDDKSWKLVSCVYGEIMQVVVDCREESNTYLHWESFTIGVNNQKMILLPPSVGNAYYVKSPQAVYHYKLAYEGNYFDANDQHSMKWNDERVQIDWPTKFPILSDRDQ